MSRPTASADRSVNVLLLVSFYGAELSAALSLLAMFKKGAEPLLPFLGTTPGIYLIGSVVALATFLLVIIHQYRISRRQQSRQFSIAVALNLLVVVPVLIAAEVSVRILANETRTGPEFLKVRLLPRDWQVESRYYLDMLASGRTRKLTIFAPDDLLGWSIAANSRSEDEMYFNSAEGIRSASSGVLLTGPRRANRIALVGDSYTYAQDVDFASSWGRRLEINLGSEYEVLNFGVPGFGVDQAYLRYQRDVRPLKPDIVVFGLISHDLMRSMTVYSFIRFPEWESPYSKPRFVTEGEDLRLLNTPLLNPTTIFSMGSVQQLPFLEYEPGYQASDWQWKLYHSSYIARFVTSKFPRWPEGRPETSGRMQNEINQKILRSFIASAERAGSTPVILYLPAPTDFGADATTGARGWLRSAGIPYLDATPCLNKLPVSDRFVTIEGRRGHFTPKANQILADLLYRTLNAGELIAFDDCVP